MKNHGVVYVKRKAGYLPYAQDAPALRALAKHSEPSLSAQGPGTAAPAGAEEAPEEPQDEDGGPEQGQGVRIVRSLAADPVAGAFARYFCGIQVRQKGGRERERERDRTRKKRRRRTRSR